MVYWSYFNESGACVLGIDGASRTFGRRDTSLDILFGEFSHFSHIECGIKTNFSIGREIKLWDLTS